jgi:hypothetical protein
MIESMKLMKKRFLFRAVLTLFIGVAFIGSIFSTTQAVGQVKADPMVVVGISSYDQLQDKLDFLGKISGNPSLSKGVEALIGGFTDGQNLDFLDKSRPLGLVVAPDPITMVGGYIFVPVRDYPAMMKFLEGAGFKVNKMEDTEDAVCQVVYEEKGISLFMKPKGDWVYLAMLPTVFATVSEKPETLLVGVKDYAFGAELFVSHIPEPLRDMLIGQIELGMTMGLEQEEGESDEQFAIRTKAAGESFKKIKTMLVEFDSLLVGFNLNEKKGDACLDVFSKAVAGSELADSWTLIKERPSKFAGFYNKEAIITVNGVGRYNQQIREMFRENLNVTLAAFNEGVNSNEALSDEKKEKAQAWVSRVGDLAADTVESGKIDIGFSVTGGVAPRDLALVGGVRVAKGAGFRKEFREIVEVAFQDKNKINGTYKFDAGKLDKIPLDKITLEIPEEPAGMRDAFGEEVTIWVGISDTAIYVAAGKDAEKKLNDAVVKSRSLASEEVMPLRASMSMGPLLRTVAMLAPDEDTRKGAALSMVLLGQAGSEDHLNVTLSSIKNGQLQRFEVEGGILKVVGALINMVQMLGASSN